MNVSHQHLFASSVDQQFTKEEGRLKLFDAHLQSRILQTLTNQGQNPVLWPRWSPNVSEGITEVEAAWNE